MKLQDNITYQIGEKPIDDGGIPTKVKVSSNEKLKKFLHNFVKKFSGVSGIARWTFSSCYCRHEATKTRRGGGASERYNLDYFKCGIKKNISFIMHIPINFKTCLSCPISLHCHQEDKFLTNFRLQENAMYINIKHNQLLFVSWCSIFHVPINSFT